MTRPRDFKNHAYREDASATGSIFDAAVEAAISEGSYWRGSHAVAANAPIDPAAVRLVSGQAATVPTIAAAVALRDLWIPQTMGRGFDGDYDWQASTRLKVSRLAEPERLSATNAADTGTLKGRSSLTCLATLAGGSDDEEPSPLEITIALFTDGIKQAGVLSGGRPLGVEGEPHQPSLAARMIDKGLVKIRTQGSLG